MSVVVAGICALAVAAVLLRWLRVSQREHYLAGSCVKFVWRWLRVSPPNTVLAGIGLAGLILGLYSEVSSRATLAALSALAVSVCVVAFPWPMPLLGEPRLRFTRRASRLAAITTLPCVLVSTMLIFVIGLPLSVAVVCMFVPAITDVSAALASPMEKRMALKFRHRAATRLAEVSPIVIAVTGSWGKTSTKEHIRDLLIGDRSVVASPASYNNAAGLSKTINELLTDTAEVFVAEMGMYRPGEIRDLCSWIRPNIAVITSVGPMHLERAGSMEQIVAAKSEVLERADAAVLWVDDPQLASLSKSCEVSRVWRVGRSGGSLLDVEVDVQANEVVVRTGAVEVGRCPVDSGVHPGNVGCAVAAAAACGATLERLRERLPMLSSPQHRSVPYDAPNGMLVIDDTFNSNPAGAIAALELLRHRVEGRRAVVTPGMVELGVEQFRRNVELGAAVVDSGASLVVVGRINRRSLMTGAGGDAVTVRNRREAREWVRETLSRNDGVLWENDLPDHYP